MLRSFTYVTSILIASAFAATAEPVKVKLGHFTNDTESGFVKVIKPWAEAVNKEAQDSIVIELYPNGALGRNLAQQPQLIDNGVQDIAFVVPGLSPGRFPDNSVFELPGLFKDMREGLWVVNNIVTERKIRGYDDFFPISEFAGPPFSIHLRKPIKSLNDLKGLKIRAGNPTEGNMLKELGAVPIVIPVNEIAEAVGRGTIDGTTASPQTLFEFGIERVTTFHYMVPLGAAPLAELMSKKVFDGLPKAGQDAIRKYSGNWFAQRYLDSLGPIMDDYVQKLRADSNRQVVSLTPDDAEKWNAAAQRVINAWIAKDPGNPAVLKLVKAEIEKVRASK
jgi:TRAP-type C4-dicarboxylate transport system substrate-binding protein